MLLFIPSLTEERIKTSSMSSANQPMPQTMGDVFTKLQELGAISLDISERLKKAVGFRNIAVHNYEAINWQIVYVICQSSLRDFRQFAQEICRYAVL